MSLSSWILATRPRTLSLSATPVIVGAALAWAAARRIDGLAAIAALIAGMLIQVGTNLHNDAADSERGGDGPDRLGPLRVTASGLLSARTVKRGACVCFVIAALLGVYLVEVGGWPILVLGTLSILCGWAYTGGPLPIAYTPLGELFVVIFFGVGAVCGTYWLCAADLNAASFTAGIALGLFAGAVLLVNNYRDVEADKRVGRRTLPIVLGARATNWIYAAMMLLPFAALLVLAHGLSNGRVWPAFAALPPALALIYRLSHEAPSRGFNKILARTALTQFLFGLLLAVGLVL